MSLHVALHRVPDVGHPVSRPGFPDAEIQRLARHVEQRPRVGVHVPHRVGLRRVPVVPPQKHAEVHRHDVPFPQHRPGRRDPVNHFVIDRSADRAREPGPARGTAVSLEGGHPARRHDPFFREPVDVERRDSRADDASQFRQDLPDDPVRLVHDLDLGRRLQNRSVHGVANAIFSAANTASESPAASTSRKSPRSLVDRRHGKRLGLEHAQTIPNHLFLVVGALHQSGPAAIARRPGRPAAGSRRETRSRTAGQIRRPDSRRTISASARHERQHSIERRPDALEHPVEDRDLSRGPRKAVQDEAGRRVRLREPIGDQVAHQIVRNQLPRLHVRPGPPAERSPLLDRLPKDVPGGHVRHLELQPKPERLGSLPDPGRSNQNDSHRVRPTG